jgi:DNA-directed RNA polymerase alpha subunit
VFLYPIPEPSDDTPVEDIRFSTRIRNALNSASFKTVGEVRETSDKALLGLQDLGQGSVDHLRKSLSQRPIMVFGRVGR